MSVDGIIDQVRVHGITLCDREQVSTGTHSFAHTVCVCVCVS